MHQAQTARTSAAARLDRLPISPFHTRMLGLIGAGMFFDSFDIYLTGSVLATLGAQHFSTGALNAQFVSWTFVGMLIGAAGAGVLGDRFGRKFTYQFNLGVFGLASLAGAAAPDMQWLLATRFVAGIGLGAEIVIGYATMIEFVPPGQRGRWAAALSLVTNCGLFVATLAAYLVIPSFGWRWMFVIAGVGALVVLWLRRAIPESPRWLEARGRHEEADALLARIEAESPSPLPHAAPAPLAAAGPALFGPGMIGRLLLGSLLLVTISVAIYGFVVWVPSILVKNGLSLNRSLGQSVLMSLGGPAGALLGVALNDVIGRKPAIVGASVLAAAVGMGFAYAGSEAVAVGLGFAMFTLIYFLVSVVVANYVPEMFPTAVRMRGAGICNMAGRLATIAVPLVAVWLLQVGGVAAVLGAVTVALLVQAGAVLVFGQETNHRSLEAIGPA